MTNFQSIKYKNVRGYTLVELLVVVALISLLMTAIIALFLTNIKSSSRATAIGRVKEEGDYVTQNLERNIRNAYAIVPGAGNADCRNPGTDNSLHNENDHLIYQEVLGGPNWRLEQYGDVLQVSDGSTTKVLTSDQVTVSDLKVYCYRPTYITGAKVHLVFTITDVKESAISETFSMRVVLRNNAY